MKLLDETNKKEIIKRIEGGEFEEKLKKFLILQGNKCLSYDETGLYFYGVPEIGFMYFGLANVKIKARVNAHITYLNDHTKGKGSEAERSIRLKDCLDKVIFIPIYNGDGFLGKKERALIKMFNSFVDDNKEFGLNYTRGGEDPSEETRKKMAEAQKGENNNNYGKTGADNHLSIACYSLDLTTLCRMKYGGMKEAERSLRKNGYKKASNATIHKAIYGINGVSSAYNKLWSLKDFNELTMEEIQALIDEHFKEKEEREKARIEASKKALKEALSKQVVMYCNETKEFKVWESASDAERAGITKQKYISRVCLGKKGRKSAGKDKDGNNLRWCFLKDYDHLEIPEWVIEEINKYKNGIDIYK